MIAPRMVAAAIPFTEEEMQVLSERAAAHGLSLVDFVRLCSLAQPTWLEVVSREPPWNHSPIENALAHGGGHESASGDVMMEPAD